MHLAKLAATALLVSTTAVLGWRHEVGQLRRTVAPSAPSDKAGARTLDADNVP